MGKLTCGCLNVKIHVKSTDLTPVDLPQLGVKVPNESSEEFFNLEISEAQLHLEGVAIEHAGLVRVRECCGWSVHECTNCEMITHAVNTAQQNTLLVNTSLKADPTIIERLMTSSDYSPLYKIVLHSSRDDNHPIRTLGVSSGKYESVQKTLAVVQEQLNTFLIEEEAQMENRIRQYEDAQRSAYATLQSKARRDKNTVMSLILAAEGSVAESLAQGVTDMQPGGDGQAVKQSAKAAAESKSVTSPKKVLSSPGKPQREAKKSRTRPRQAVDNVAVAMEALETDDIFDLDTAFEEEEDKSSQPFYDASDEETEDTDDSETEVGQRDPYSTSVPISIHWNTSQRSYGEEGGVPFRRERGHTPEVENIGASIKALARSVHADGRELFGELPRNRFSSDMDKL